MVSKNKKIASEAGKKQAKPPKKPKPKKPKLTPEQRSEVNRKNGALTVFKPNDEKTGYKDPRINRTKTPKMFFELRKLALQLMHEKITDPNGAAVLAPDGQEMTAVEYILRRAMMDTKKDMETIYIAFGKPVDTNIQLTKEQLERLTEEQIDRLLNGEDLLSVLLYSATHSGEGTTPAN